MRVRCAHGLRAALAPPGLRSAIDRRGLRINEEFLSASETAQKARALRRTGFRRGGRALRRLTAPALASQALMAVEAQLAGLATCCDQMASALSASQASTAGLLADTEALRAELASNARRGVLVADFLDKYQLTSAEVAALREGDVGGDAFFDALERVAAIHANCRALLRRHHQRAGLELMDAMALYQEGAYERLCRWVQAQCRALGEADVPEVTPQLARATAALRARPLLHRYAAEEAANARHQALFGRFLAALTRGGPGGVPRAMEAHSHDPRRYIGDMCAWLHQACAGERELVAALLGDEEGRAQTEEADAAQLADAAWVLDRIFEGVCRPFKVRVEAALGGVPPTALLLAFQLHALLSFYTSTLAAVAGRASVLTAAVADCHTAALAALYGQLGARKERLARFPPAPGADAAPPPPFAEAATRLTELLDAAESAVEAGNVDFDAILAALLDPLLDAAQHGAPMAAGAAGAPQWAGSAYAVNCLSTLAAALSGRELCASRSAALEEAVETHFAALVAAAAGTVLAECGLAAMLELAAARLADPGPALAPGAAGPALEALYARLTSSTTPFGDFKQLQSARARADASRRVAAAVADAYDRVHAAIMAAHPRAALRFSVLQVRTVCDGL